MLHWPEPTKERVEPTTIGDTGNQRRSQGGAEGAQAPPPLSNQNIDVYFLSFSPTL